MALILPPGFQVVIKNSVSTIEQPKTHQTSHDQILLKWTHAQSATGCTTMRRRPSSRSRYEQDRAARNFTCVHEAFESYGEPDIIIGGQVYSQVLPTEEHRVPSSLQHVPLKESSRSNNSRYIHLMQFYNYLFNWIIYVIHHEMKLKQHWLQHVFFCFHSLCCLWLFLCKWGYDDIKHFLLIFQEQICSLHMPPSSFSCIHPQSSVGWSEFFLN